MKVSAINNKSIQNIRSIVPDKAATLAYSSLFSLALLSGAATSSDLFVKNKNTQQSEQINDRYVYQNNTVKQAQSVYTDMWGQQWVPYSEYQSLENRTEIVKEKYENLKKEYDELEELLSDKQDKLYDINEIYEKMVKKVDVEQDWIKSLNYRIESYYEPITRKAKHVGSNTILSAIITFLITLGIAALNNIERKRRNNIRID